MKLTIILSFIILFSAQVLRAQDNFIGATKQSADSTMNENHSKFLSASLTTDTKLPFNTFKNEDGSITLLYYDGNNICYQSAVMYKTTNVDAVKDILKRQFDQQNEKQWIRRDNKVKAEMLILSTAVVIKYSKI